LATSVFWLAVLQRTGQRIALAAAWTGPAAILVGMVPYLAGPALFYDWGMVGLCRTVGWSILVYAIVQADILDLGLAPRTLSRGTLAAFALAALFIVAQVAQNFLSAEYGLLTGGVIAGTVLFAASPVQKAIERVGERRADGPPAPATSATASRRREDVYLSALRLAMRDRRLTRDEEVHLHRLAEELGIGAGRAHELMVAVEGERAKVRRKT
jgi:hypothetical protein